MCIKLNINGIEKNSIDVNYNDLIILYKQFIEKYGYIPLTKDAKSKYNLPQQRIIMKVLESNNISYNDFIRQFGKVSHIRSDIKNYNYYIDKFKDICKEIGRTLYYNELINNNYGLPSAKWLIDNCPDKDVLNYTDFVKWCDLSSNKKIYTKEEVTKSLVQLEKKLKRPIIKSDITIPNVGFSSIVVTRIWGTFGKCKEELGLMQTLPNQPKPFDFYKDNLEETLTYLKNNISRNIITWKDIESYHNSANHKAYLNSFRLANVDIYAFIKSKGFMMNPSDFSFHYTFDDGERVVSTYEYDFSEYLKSLNLIYQEDYYRDCMYRKFIPNLGRTKINCDYYIFNKVIEIAGIIHNYNNDWENNITCSKQEKIYKEKLQHKKALLEMNNINYLFLFPEDFIDKKYQDKFINFLNRR